MERYVGLMTGTSMDGIDAVRAVTDGERLVLEAARYTPFEADLRDALLMVDGETPLATLARLDARVGDALAAAAAAMIPADGGAVTAVGSHGQTVWHAPGGRWPNTLQIGDPSRVARGTGRPVVADFRRGDQAAGGEGAPLAPAFHAALFAAGGEDRVVVNLGGMANITLLPAGRPEAVRGFDTGPGNALLDIWNARNGRGSFDPGGAWAATGTVERALLAHFEADPYFRRPAPKSTGREHFNAAWLEAAPLAAHQPADVQATLATLTARTVAAAATQALPEAATVIVCGGGAHNADLLDRLAAELPRARVVSSTAFGVDPDWVEAAGFAWLAHQRIHHRPGNIPGVTGADRWCVLGAVYPPG